MKDGTGVYEGHVHTYKDRTRPESNTTETSCPRGLTELG